MENLDQAYQDTWIYLQLYRFQHEAALDDSHRFFKLDACGG